MSILLASHAQAPPTLFAPETGEVTSGPHRFIPRGQVSWTPGPEDLVVLTHDDAVLLCHPLDLTPTVKLTPPGMPWRHIAACGRHIVGVDAHLGLQVLDWFTRTRYHTSLKFERHVANLWTNSRWLAMRSWTDQHWGISLWSVDRASQSLTLHTPHLNRRHTTGPTATLDPKHVWCAFALNDTHQDLGFLYTSALPGAHTPAGWRGVVEGVDLNRGEVVWEVEIEGSWTHDTRPTADVSTDPRGVCVVPGARPGTHELWVGGAAGSVVVLDTRDGALLEVLHIGGTREVTSHLWDGEGRHLLATRGGGWTSL